MRSPTLSLFAGRTSARQRHRRSRSMSVASIGATNSSLTRTPSRRAAITRVSLTTSASPGRRKSGRSKTQASMRARPVRQPASGRCRAAKRAEAQSARAEARNRRRRRASVNLAAAAGGDRRRREKVFRAPRAALSLQLSRRRDDLVGLLTGSPRLILSTFSIPDTTFAPHRILTVEKAGGREADEELRIGGIRAGARAIGHGPAHMRLRH